MRESMQTQTAAPEDGARRILFLLGRFTLLRPMTRTSVVEQLCQLCDSIIRRDAAAAVFSYHGMTAALIEQETRRVTGDIWKDFIFSMLIECPNRFSLLAAEGKMDPPVKASMAHDLRLLQELFDLNAPRMQEWVGGTAPKNGERAQPETPSYRQVTPEREKNIASMASSAWQGAMTPGSFTRFPQQAERPVEARLQGAVSSAELELDQWMLWSYDEPGEHAAYVADEALAILYRRFLAEDDWANLLEQLREFHASYGCGAFLRHRCFVAADDGFLPLDAGDAPEWDALYALGDQKEQLYANTLRFLHTGKGENVLLFGAEGMGKTSLLLALAGELEDIRFVFLTQRDAGAAAATIRSLSGQPFRFIAVFDDMSMHERDYRRMRAAFSGPLRPKNVLIYATAGKKAPDHSLFPLQIGFEMFDEEAFLQMVGEEIRQMRLFVDPQEIENACRTWREQGNDLSARSVKNMAQNLSRQAQR